MTWGQQTLQHLVISSLQCKAKMLQCILTMTFTLGKSSTLATQTKVKSNSWTNVVSKRIFLNGPDCNLWSKFVPFMCLTGTWTC